MRLKNSIFLAVLAGCLVAGAGLVRAQAPAAAPGPAPATFPFKPFAPGVVTTIKPAPEVEELFSGPRPLVEVPISIPGLEYDPQLNPKSDTIFERSKGAILRRTIWNLEFSFKPMRMIYVDVPQPTGRMQRKLVWYMVYRVRNLGKHLKPKEDIETIAKAVEPETVHIKYVTEETDEITQMGQPTTSIRFFPHFILASTEYGKEYLDRIVPAALEPIRQREFPGRQNVQLFDSLTISEQPIPISDEKNDRSVWGVVTWIDVDPRIDYYILYIQGLTNAYKYDDPAGGFKAGDQPGTGRKIVKKTLQLNFWRPGDTVDPHEEEIRYGCRIDSNPVEQDKIFKQFGIDKPIDYLWLYR
ncbi:MAG: hypothetical protein SFU86_19110 [Pirellulaceae bacterium]|nr:hypothetical protein [Pirellulaceae bacterium]